MANTEGYTFSNTADTTGDRLNTTVRDAVMDLANNVSGSLDGSNIATGTIPASEFSASWATASTPHSASAGDFLFITAGDTVTLPTSPTVSDTVSVAQKDGDFTSSAGTIDGTTKNIDDNGFTTPATTWAIDRNFIGRLEFVYDGTQWRIT